MATGNTWDHLRVKMGKRHEERGREEVREGEGRGRERLKVKYPFKEVLASLGFRQDTLPPKTNKILSSKNNRTNLRYVSPQLHSLKW